MIKEPESLDLQLKIAKHMLKFRLEYFKFFENMYKLLQEEKDKTISFGDADFFFTLIHDEPKDKNGEYRRAFLVKDVCTCSDKNRWVVIVNGDEFGCKIHVRIIYEKGDYPRAQYPEKLNLRFYKDRKFVMEYIDKYHMTNLGSVYGDIRDNGYVISYEKALGAMANMDKIYAQKDLYNLSSFYLEWKRFTFLLHVADLELKENKSRNA